MTRSRYWSTTHEESTHLLSEHALRNIKWSGPTLSCVNETYRLHNTHWPGGQSRELEVWVTGADAVGVLLKSTTSELVKALGHNTFVLHRFWAISVKIGSNYHPFLL
jgi:hypothetical protein